MLRRGAREEGGKMEVVAKCMHSVVFFLEGLKVLHFGVLPFTASFFLFQFENHVVVRF